MMSSQVTSQPAASRGVRTGLFRSWSLRAAAAALAVGAAAGLAVAWVGPVLTLAGLLGLLILVLAFSHPEWVVVLVLAFASGLIPSRFNLFISLGVGSVQISDLLLLWLLAVLVLRVTLNEISYRATPLDLPLILFYGAVLIGLGTSVIGFGVRFGDATYEARTLLYYLIFFPITTLVRTPAQATRLAGGVVVVGVLMAVTMLLQSTLRPAILMAEPWMVQGERLVRNFNPGFTTVYLALMILLAYVAIGQPRHRWLFWGGVLSLTAALLATMARNILIAGGLSIVLLLVLVTRGERLRLARDVLTIVMLTVILVLIIATLAEAPTVARYVDAYALRVERMFSSDILSREENLFSRWTEIEFALDRLREHPVLGIGLYNPYRPAFFREEDVTLRHFIHNTYVGLWLKTGLLGLLSFLALALIYVRHSLQGWCRVENPLLRAAVLGSAMTFVGMFASNLVAPSFIQPGSLAIFGVLLGLSETILLNTTESHELAKGELDER